MFAVIDCGTTNTRIYIINNDKIIAMGEEKVGVRDTSITNSKDTLKNGIENLYKQIIKQNKIDKTEINFALASGMITSEIGLIEIPHLIAPVGLGELSNTIKVVEDENVLNLGVPVCFIRGVRNNYPQNATIEHLRFVDFMRGEEVQCIGLLKDMNLKGPLSIVVLSSHTKIVYIDENNCIAGSITSMSGQIFEAVVKQTNVGSSIVETQGETSSGLNNEKIIEVAEQCVKQAGFIRALFMPRFMKVLLQTNSAERRLFADAAIATDDMKCFDEMDAQNMHSDSFILFGHENRCKLYSEFLYKKYGQNIQVQSIYDKEKLAELTVKGASMVAKEYIKKQEK